MPLGQIHCKTCGCTIDEKMEARIKETGREFYGECIHCMGLGWGETLKILQMRRLAEVLEKIERKLPDKNRW